MEELRIIDHVGVFSLYNKRQKTIRLATDVKIRMAITDHLHNQFWEDGVNLIKQEMAETLKRFSERQGATDENN